MVKGEKIKKYGYRIMGILQEKSIFTQNGYLNSTVNRRKIAKLYSELHLITENLFRGQKNDFSKFTNVLVLALSTYFVYVLQYMVHNSNFFY